MGIVQGQKSREWWRCVDGGLSLLRRVWLLLGGAGTGCWKGTRMPVRGKRGWVEG